MKPELQRIKIAEACGWGFVPSGDDGNGNAFPESWITEDGVEAFDQSMLPDYLHDLNDMHEAEKVLTDEQRELYISMLCGLSGATDYDAFDFAITATAAQRAEAFLKTIGKWGDEA